MEMSGPRGPSPNTVELQPARIKRVKKVKGTFPDRGIHTTVPRTVQLSGDKTLSTKPFVHVFD